MVVSSDAKTGINAEVHGDVEEVELVEWGGEACMVEEGRFSESEIIWDSLGEVFQLNQRVLVPAGVVQPSWEDTSMCI